MYPLDEPVLNFYDIAHHWSREQLPGTPAAEVLNRLLFSFWRGDLTIRPTWQVAESLADHRPKVLEAVARLDDHPGLLILRPGAEVEPQDFQFPDGSASVDVSIRVMWPVSDDTSMLEARQEAYDALARAEFDAYSRVMAPALLGLEVERDAFGQFCAERGYPRPKFWFAPSANFSSSAARRRCQSWLKEQTQRRDKPGPKAKIRAEAVGKFPGLSGRVFDRVWAEVAPPNWTQSGAPKGKRSRPPRAAKS